MTRQQLRNEWREAYGAHIWYVPFRDKPRKNDDPAYRK